MKRVRRLAPQQLVALDTKTKFANISMKYWARIGMPMSAETLQYVQMESFSVARILQFFGGCEHEVLSFASMFGMLKVLHLLVRHV